MANSQNQIQCSRRFPTSPNPRYPALPPIRLLLSSPVIAHSSHILQEHRIHLPRLPSMADATTPVAESISPALTPDHQEKPAVIPKYHPRNQYMLPEELHETEELQQTAPGQYSVPGAVSQSARKVKRRTKTGCLTCRSRRIKCDETRPTCRNCTKSKRECLGYDPIFRGGSEKPTSTSIAPSPMAEAPSKRSDPGWVDYYNCIDPTLDANGGPHPIPGEFDPSRAGRLTAPPCNIEDLLDAGNGLPPPPIPSSITIDDADREFVKRLYDHFYGPALDKFFDSRWYTDRGLHHVLNTTAILEKFKVLKTRFGYSPHTDLHEYLVTTSLETRIIWDIMLLARQVSLSVATTNDPAATIEIAEGIHEAAQRLDTFEALVTNSKLDPANAIPEPETSGTVTPAGMSKLQGQLDSRAQKFWHYTSKFCTLRDDNISYADNPEEEIEKAMWEMRQLLDSRESRDMLYCIACVRHYGHKMAALAAAGEPLPKVTNTETPMTVLNISRKFLVSETNIGCTQIAQRVAGMAVMAWSKR